MGHITCLGIIPEKAMETAHYLKNTIRCISEAKENKPKIV
jgi:hypothetical protein